MKVVADAGLLVTRNILEANLFGEIERHGDWLMVEYGDSAVHSMTRCDFFSTWLVT